jgi:hypothetical protein
VAERAADGPGAAPIVVALVVLAVAFVVMFWVMRRRDRSVSRSKAGANVRSGGRPADRQRAAPAYGAGESAPPDGGARRRFGKVGRQIRGLVVTSGGRPAREPVLTQPVDSYSAWGHTVCEGVCGDEIRMVIRAATVRGLAHAFAGTEAQDALGLVWNRDRGALLAVVADGLGSLPDSGRVAHRTVRRVLQIGQGMRSGDDFRQLPRRVAIDVRDYIQRQDLRGATTAVLCEIRPVAGGAEVTTLAVGDSEAWFLHDGSWNVIYHERRTDGENITRHLPDQLPDRPCRTRVPHGSVLLLATDGLASALGVDGTPLGHELAARWRRPPAGPEFLSHVDFEDKYFSDDRAAVAVWIN